MSIKCGINGFGRIGRLIFRQSIDDEQIKIVSVNDLIDANYAAYLLKYDSVHGKFPYKITVLDKNKLSINDNIIYFQKEREAINLKWGDYEIETVIESTGLNLTQEKCINHIKAGAKKVIISAPAKDNTNTYVMGVNHTEYKGEDIVSNASCTTNCLAPIAKVINDAFGINKGLMSTIHATTATQKTVDGNTLKDWRGGRSAIRNIIPATTGATKAVVRVLPELDGKLSGMAFRVPVADVSVVDFTFLTTNKTSYDDICEEIKKASDGAMYGIIEYIDEPIVSSDIIGNKHTSIFDAKAGMSLGNDFFKIVAWYDNEIGYSNKTIDLAKHISNYKGT